VLAVVALVELGAELIAFIEMLVRYVPHMVSALVLRQKKGGG
jgi:hypothetical protein